MDWLAIKPSEDLHKFISQLKGMPPEQFYGGEYFYPLNQEFFVKVIEHLVEKSDAENKTAAAAADAAAEVKTATEDTQKDADDSQKDADDSQKKRKRAMGPPMIVRQDAFGTPDGVPDFM